MTCEPACDMDYNCSIVEPSINQEKLQKAYAIYRARVFMQDELLRYKYIRLFSSYDNNNLDISYDLGAYKNKMEFVLNFQATQRITACPSSLTAKLSLSSTECFPCQSIVRNSVVTPAFECHLYYRYLTRQPLRPPWFAMFIVSTYYIHISV